MATWGLAEAAGAAGKVTESHREGQDQLTLNSRGPCLDAGQGSGEQGWPAEAADAVLW